MKLSELENRIETLEMRTAFQENTLQQLDDVIIQQQKQLDHLETANQLLIQKIDEMSDSQGEQAQVDERPPHY
ncbi:MAG: SlyX family protein [bacterium]